MLLGFENPPYRCKHCVHAARVLRRIDGVVDHIEASARKPRIFMAEVGEWICPMHVVGRTLRAFGRSLGVAPPNSFRRGCTALRVLERPFVKAVVAKASSGSLQFLPGRWNPHAGRDARFAGRIELCLYLVLCLQCFFWHSFFPW